MHNDLFNVNFLLRFGIQGYVLSVVFNTYPLTSNERVTGSSIWTCNYFPQHRFHSKQEPQRINHSSMYCNQYMCRNFPLKASSTSCLGEGEGVGYSPRTACTILCSTVTNILILQHFMKLIFLDLFTMM